MAGNACRTNEGNLLEQLLASLRDVAACSLCPVGLPAAPLPG